MVAEMGKSLTACMTGDITKINTAYKLTYFSNNKEYMIRIVPKAEEQREYIRELQITLSRSNLSVTSLTIDESDNNTTVYRFTNVKYNTITSDAKIAMKKVENKRQYVNQSDFKGQFPSSTVRLQQQR